MIKVVTTKLEGYGKWLEPLSHEHEEDLALDGSARDIVMYSILASDWPEVQLQQRLARNEIKPHTGSTEARGHE